MLHSADRAWPLRPLAKQYGYWMIGVVDPDGTISTTLRYRTSHVERDYIPRIMSSKRAEISDPFSAGSTEELNYSVFVPVIRNGEVVSIVFVSTLLDELAAAVRRAPFDAAGYCLLLDSRRRIISHPATTGNPETVPGLSYDEVVLYGMTHSEWQAHLGRSEGDASYLSWSGSGLLYTMSTPLPGTNWMIIARVRVLTAVGPLLIGFAVQAGIYVLLFAFLQLLASRHLAQEFRPVDSLLRQLDQGKALFRYGNDNGYQATLDALELTRRGLRDDLTGLPSLVMFRKMLARRARELPAGALPAIFHLDMDGLKTINEAFGHARGDAILKHYGRILEEERERLKGLCSRPGGDEFLLFVPQLADEQAAKNIADGLLRVFGGVVEKDGRSLEYGVNIGIAFYPLHSTSLERVAELAERALARARQAGRNRWVVHSGDEEGGST